MSDGERTTLELTGAVVLAISLFGGVWWTINTAFDALAAMQRNPALPWWPYR